MNEKNGERTWIDERAARSWEMEDARRRMHKLADEYVSLRHTLVQQEEQGMVDAAKRRKELLAEKARQYKILKDIVEFNS